MEMCLGMMKEAYQKKKGLLFWRKEAKDFYYFGTAAAAQAPRETKVFCFFFF